jgi:hypothetical protein
MRVAQSYHRHHRNVIGISFFRDMGFALADHGDFMNACRKPGSQPSTTEPLTDRHHMAHWFAILCVVMLSARWILIGGTGEYGMLYDQAYRLYLGQVWYRDILSTTPPLTAHFLSWLFRLASPSLLLYNVHLYLWWWASLFIGYLLLRRFDIRGLMQCAALIAYASLSLPCLSLGHAYFYASGVLGGLIVLCFDLGFGADRPGLMFCVGLLGGITMFARQNMAVGMIAGMALLYLLLLVRRSITYRRAWVDLGLMTGGFALSFCSILLAFSRKSSAGEVLHELLLDGTQGKAGKFGILARIIPKISLRYSLPHRRWFEIAISIMVYLFFLWWMAHRKKRTGDRPHVSSEFKPLVIAIAALLTANLITLVPVGHYRGLDSSTWPVIPSAITIGTDLINIAWFCTMTWYLLASWKTMPERRLALGVIGFSAFTGTILSSQSYSVHIAPVLVPLTIAVIGAEASSRSVIRSLGVLTAIWAALSVLSMPTSFQRLVPIRGSGQFAGVIVSADYAEELNELLVNVTPRISGKSVLWFKKYGPNPAFGGIPAPSVVPWDKGAFHPRQIPYLVGRWQKSLPQYVVSGPFWGGDDGQFGPESEFGAWFTATYSEKWCSGVQPGLCLWEQTSWPEFTANLPARQ